MTYAARSCAVLKQTLYDNYVRSIRWSSDRIGDRGVIGFVTNAGYIDSRSADELRRCLVEEFSSLYVFGLRGNARSQGDVRKAEGGNVFGGGSRAPIAVSILVKNPEAGESGVIYYHDIADYLTREQKLVSKAVCSVYRPYTKQWLYYDSFFNSRSGKTLKLYPCSTPVGLAMIVFWRLATMVWNGSSGMVNPSSKQECLLRRLVDVRCLPMIAAESYCLFRRVDTPSSPDHAVLVRYSGLADPETGGQYSVKLFRSDGDKVVLRSVNREFADIVADEGVRIIGEVVCVL